MLYFNRKDFCVFSFIFVFLLCCLRSAFCRFFLFHMENNVQLDDLKKNDIIGYDKVLESFLYPYENSLLRGSQNERKFILYPLERRDIHNAHVNIINKSSVVREKRLWVSSEFSAPSFFPPSCAAIFCAKKGAWLDIFFSLKEKFPPTYPNIVRWFYFFFFSCQRQYTLACLTQTQLNARHDCAAHRHLKNTTRVYPI